MKVSFSPPDMTESEIEEVCDAIRSGWITTGPKTKEFEKQIAKYCHVNKAVCLNSQTACAQLALWLLGIGPGDECMVPAYTYTATASVVCHTGASLVLVDIQKGSLEMDYDALANAITEKTKVIIPVDLGGVPCDYQKIFSIVEEKKYLFRPANRFQEAIGRIAICADTAHAFGASYHGKKIGSVADFSSFSWHAVKNLTTAEGGAMTWKEISGVSDEEIYRLAQLYSLHGQSRDALEKNRPGAWEYDILGPWYKCNMSDILAALGLAQMRRYESLLARRKEIIRKYDSAWKPLGIEVLNHDSKEHQSSGHLYMTWIPHIGLKERQEIILALANAGIAANVHYKPLPMMTAYKNLGFDIQEFPNAYGRFVNEITLPLHTRLTEDEVEYVITTYSDIVKKYL